VYKIIFKIVSNRIKPKLSKMITKKQFGFQQSKQIMDGVGITHEWLRSVKTKKLEALVLKMNLVKHIIESIGSFYVTSNRVAISSGGLDDGMCYFCMFCSPC